MTGHDPALARDAFVFRRVASNRFAHVGGWGRGEAWAGIIELDATHDPVAKLLVREAPCVREHVTAARRWFGPYWACSIVVVRTSHDEVVVFGEPHDDGGDDDAWVAAANDVAADVTAVAPAKRLADELELLHAVRDVALTPAVDVDAVASAVVEAVAAALSCGVAALRLRSGTTHALGGDDALLANLVERLVASVPDDEGPRDGPWVVQEAHDTPVVTDALPSARSFVLAPVGEIGHLLCVHAGDDRRGFTQLCQAIVAQTATAADTVLLAAQQREAMQRAARDASREARRDALTGLGNRRAWDEWLAGAEGRGDPVTLVVLDVNALKEVNDLHGHAAGDELLRRAAALLVHSVRRSDMVVRLGGDEFGVILPDADPEAVVRLTEHLRTAADRSGDDGPPVSFAVGHATSRPGERLEDVVRRADRRMYDDKRQRVR